MIKCYLTKLILLKEKNIYLRRNVLNKHHRIYSLQKELYIPFGMIDYVANDKCHKKTLECQS